MINKPTILISSLGRTGTTFFTKYFQKIFPESLSVHEPGMIRIKGPQIKNISEAISIFGFRNAVLRKLLNLPDIKYISRRRMEGRITKEEAASLALKLRRNFIEGRPEPLYIESNYQFQGLLDILPLVFENYRAVYIIRDPRDWARSFINWRGLYHFTDLHYLLGNRLSPTSVGDGKYAEKWKRMDQFEKLCWAWNYINDYAIKSAAKNQAAKIYLFENIFASGKGKDALLELTEFCQRLDGVTAKPKEHILSVIDSSLRHKVNKPETYDFPAWPEWSAGQARRLHEICGANMAQLGYGNEKDWLDLIK